MPFEKRVCVLKQVKKGFTADGSALSGAVYCERLGEEITVMPRLLGIAPVKEGRYALALWVAGGALGLAAAGSFLTFPADAWWGRALDLVLSPAPLIVAAGLAGFLLWGRPREGGADQ